MFKEKLCLNCKKYLIGRSDKKFCNDKCRSHFNYSIHAVNHNNAVKSIDSTLKKNLKILKILHARGQTKVWKRTMLAKGFDFNYFTSMQTITEHGKSYFCYDVGYTVINSSEIVLLKIEIR